MAMEVGGCPGLEIITLHFLSVCVCLYAWPPCLLELLMMCCLQMHSATSLLIFCYLTSQCMYAFPSFLRGTEEHAGLVGKVDIINSTLGKALGGAAGGYTTGPRELISLLRQKSRPYLFSNSLPPPVVVGASKVCYGPFD